MKLDIYVNYPGHCEEAFRFYAGHLDGQITAMLRLRDLPAHVPGPPGSRAA